jgi:hypothetical protein
MAPTLAGPGSGPAAVTGLPLTVVPGSTQVFVRVPDPQGGPDLEFGGGRWWPWRIEGSADGRWYPGGPIPAAILRTARSCPSRIAAPP